MLVLTRRVDESIVIANNITITILGIEGDKVKIGINAPREVPILRHELWLALQEQGRDAENPEPPEATNQGQENPPAGDQAETGEKDNSTRDA